MVLLLFLLAAVLYSVGGLFMKASSGLTRFAPSLAMFLLFCAAAACQAIGMRQREMASAYVVVLGLEAIVAVGLGYLVLGERLSGMKLAAMVVILTGVVMLERS